ncbi:MAG: GNAT family N-acetyltransferase [Catenulispora sp.]|nr:GNAT family N-acetyltransferase [Catenulispora sp.]
MTREHHLIEAQLSDTDVLSQVIALSFHALAPSEWLIADPAERTRIFPGYFRLYVTDAMTRGRVYTTEDRTAAALWLPGGPTADPEPADYDERLSAETGPHIERFRLFDAILAKHHPAAFSHDHLAILAVHPQHQNQGIGSALLQTHHERLDSRDPAGVAYLEASDAGTRELYLKHGYRDHGTPIELPEGPSMYPMVRAAP